MASTNDTDESQIKDASLIDTPSDASLESSKEESIRAEQRSNVEQTRDLQACLAQLKRELHASAESEKRALAAAIEAESNREHSKTPTNVFSGTF